ncbi:MAG: rhomboid family intramembrane serine protease [Bacteroidales bacterium]|nr:rhomboid family intramembrane serine protease [Bacteroidales bacterium]
MVSIADEIRASFRKGSVVTKLIYVNLGVFLAIKLISVIFFLAGYSIQDFEAVLLRYLAVPSGIGDLILKPWTLITYMFLHVGFLHILGNLLWLFWFGRIFIRYLSEKQLLTSYFLGGLAGAALFIISFNLFPIFEGTVEHAIAFGASASITAIVIAIAVYAPDYTVYLPFIGPVKIKYIALIFIALDLIQIPVSNAGGHIAHLGGAVYGYFFAVSLRKGKDIGKGFSALTDSIVSLFSRKPNMKVSYKSKAREMDDFDYNKSKADHQKEIDKILDKIAKSGYDSLTKKEKETLFRMSKKS